MRTLPMFLAKPLLASSVVPVASAVSAAKLAFEPATINQAAAAAGVLGNVRIPAALIGGAAIGQLWAHLPENSKGHQRLRSAHTKLIATTICFELVAVFVSTATAVRLMAGDYDQFAAHAVGLLVREFELQYLAIRLCFFSGVMTFVSALAVRAYSMIPDADLKKAVVCTFLGTVTLMLAFYSSTFASYENGVVGGLLRVAVLTGKAMLAHPLMASISLACFGGAGYFGVVKELIGEHVSKQE